MALWPAAHDRPHLRSDTWPHQPATAKLEKSLANGEPGSSQSCQGHHRIGPVRCQNCLGPLTGAAGALPEATPDCPGAFAEFPGFSLRPGALEQLSGTAPTQPGGTARVPWRDAVDTGCDILFKVLLHYCCGLARRLGHCRLHGQLGTETMSDRMTGAG
jgi:hypothetical protein